MALRAAFLLALSFSVSAPAVEPAPSCPAVPGDVVARPPVLPEQGSGWLLERHRQDIAHIRRAAPRWSPACLIAPAQAKALVESGEGVLVDVRRPEQFDRIRVPGSINIPLTALGSRGFLRGRRTILLDAGFSHATLEEACHKLRAGGMERTYVLEGGALGWRASGGVLEGDPLAERDLALVDPRQVVAEQRAGDWQVARWEVAASDPLALQGEPAQQPVASPLAGAVPAVAGTNITRVLAVGSDGEDYEPWRIRPGDGRAVFFLAGGARAYFSYLDQLRGMFEAAQRRPEAPTCRR